MCKRNFNTNEIFNYLFLKLGEDRVLNIKMQIKSSFLSNPVILILMKFFTMLWVIRKKTPPSFYDICLSDFLIEL